MSHIDIKKLSFAGFLVSVGIVFGDIGTSPLYTYSAILGKAPITELVALGGVSAIFWTLTFQTTIKYVLITLKADNNGEGGIFSLYTLIRRHRRWLLFPALAGGAFLLADSIITPPISVSSAIEGLEQVYPDLPVVPIVVAILVGLFVIQQKGTSFIGKLFGPAMLVWFTMIGLLGLNTLVKDLSVLRALNPYYAYRMLAEYPHGFWLLGGVFLCTTGAEALYSDLGHCGRKNIQVSWIYVKACLILCYLGQSAWLLQHVGQPLSGVTPFFGLVPSWFLLPCIGIATLATIIASQALISGSFTLVAEAIRLNLWPKLRVKYPSDVKGQLYIPTINWLLMAGCIVVTLYFRESKNMEAAFGLSVTLTMLMTTILLSFYLYSRRVKLVYVFGLLALFLSIEISFLVANLAKFMHGGWVTLMLGLGIFTVMYIWFRAHEIKRSLQEFASLGDYIPILRELSNDMAIPKYATNLVYLTSAENSNKIEMSSIRSILYKQPKRADLYWFIHINVMDEPYHMSYKAEILAKEDVVWVNFKLGFRTAPRLNLLFRKVVEDLVASKEVSIENRYVSLDKFNIAGDFRFVIMNRFLSFDNDNLPFAEKVIMRMYFNLKKISLPDQKEYGLDYSNLTVEHYPLIINPHKELNLVREF